MQHVLVLRNSRLLAQNSVALGSTMLGGLLNGIAYHQNTSPSLLLEWNHHDILAVRFRHNILVGKYFDLGSSPLLTLLFLQYGEEVIPFLR